MSNKRKVLISTLNPLGGNYGGALQAYALQETIKRMGHDVTTLDSVMPIYTIRRRLGVFKRFVFQRILGRSPAHINVSLVPEYAIYTRRFVEKYIATVDLYHGRSKPRSGDVESYDTFITGSDQVLRAKYVEVPQQLFNYVRKTDALLLSYAASFGRDDMLEYSPRLIKQTKSLASRFEAISVREDSGVNLVAEAWNRKAYHHVDPTMLIESKTYESIVGNSSVKTYPSKGDIFVYVLDRGDRAARIVSSTVSHLNGTPFELLPESYQSREELIKSPSRYALPAIEQWLRSFLDARFIVTDSFHGTVFSIIFNKPFIAIGNKSRGLARFESLLSIFGLENRLITSAGEVTEELINEKIDWANVNAKIKSEQKRSFEYLKRHLG